VSPRVSIVLPTYNGARFLEESVRSCLEQSHRDLELIVVIDGSTDGTREILGRFDDPRLVIVDRENRGLPTSLNDGFAVARGELWSWTSDDNAYLPDAIRVMVEHLDAHPGAPMVCTDCLVIDSAGVNCGYNDAMWASFIYRRSAAELAGPYRPEFRLVEDVDFFLRLEHYAGPIERIRAPHYRYRLHEGSLSHQQLAARHFISLKLHYDLVQRGVEKLDLRELFLDRLSKTAMHGDPDAIERIVAFARERAVPFLPELELRASLLRTRPGWLVNRAQIALSSRWSRLRSRLKLLRSGT
jgi:glycosyltransferase involved in cell wall biosynthesis